MYPDRDKNASNKLSIEDFPEKAIWIELTAMSGLSARTYSCGSDGDRFGGGDSDSFLKYFTMPAGFSSIGIGDSSSVNGADDSDEESESESDMADMVVWCMDVQ